VVRVRNRDNWLEFMLQDIRVCVEIYIRCSHLTNLVWA
jgi:hypothetical protein